MSDIKRQEHEAAAIELFRQALVLNPDCVDAMIGIALARIYQVINLYRLDGRDTLLDEAEALISRSYELASNHQGVLKARALLLRARQIRRGNSCHRGDDRPQPRRADGL